VETLPTPEVLTSGQPGKKESRSGFFSFLVDVLETLILSVILFVGINAVSARIRVDGSSMEPTLHAGQFVIVNKLAYRFGAAARGDVIVFHFPRNPDQEYIKRVIGLPGDTVAVENGQITVNGELLDEPYLDGQTGYPGIWTVPVGHIFVLGDNRNNSFDSHNWGTVPMDYVIGKAILVYWPPTDWGLVEHVPTASAAP
jgi:signal peptidase I